MQPRLFIPKICGDQSLLSLKAEVSNFRYEKFKKIGGYKLTILNGVKVRNALEKTIGDFLCISNIKFRYEPYININQNCYFPDFLIDKVIIEVTEWNRPSKSKINRLNNKIRAYLSGGYKVYFFIPFKSRNFYKELQCPVISTVSELRFFLPS